MTFITSFFGSIIGGVLHAMGYDPSTKQFWIILTLYALPHAFWFYRDWRREQ